MQATRLNTPTDTVPSCPGARADPSRQRRRCCRSRREYVEHFVPIASLSDIAIVTHSDSDHYKAEKVAEVLLSQFVDEAYHGHVVEPVDLNLNAPILLAFQRV